MQRRRADHSQRRPGKSGFAQHSLIARCHPQPSERPQKLRVSPPPPSGFLPSPPPAMSAHAHKAGEDLRVLVRWKITRCGALSSGLQSALRRNRGRSVSSFHPKHVNTCVFVMFYTRTHQKLHFISYIPGCLHADVSGL